MSIYSVLSGISNFLFTIVVIGVTYFSAKQIFPSNSIEDTKLRLAHKLTKIKNKTCGRLHQLIKKNKNSIQTSKKALYLYSFLNKKRNFFILMFVIDTDNLYWHSLLAVFYFKSRILLFKIKKSTNNAYKKLLIQEIEILCDWITILFKEHQLDLRQYSSYRDVYDDFILPLKEKKDPYQIV